MKSRLFSVLSAVVFVYLGLHQASSETVVLINSVYRGNIYGSICIDAPESSVTCGWHLLVFIDPIVTTLTIYNTFPVAQEAHYHVVRDAGYNRALSFIGRLCLSFAASSPDINYPSNPNITANFVCTCNTASTEDCSSRTYTFNTTTTRTTKSASTTPAPPPTTPAPPPTTPAPLPTTTASTTPTPGLTTPLVHTISSTEKMDSTETNVSDALLPMTTDQKKEYRMWKRNHVSDNYNYKYHPVESVTDCAQWCSHYVNCTGFTIYREHCWPIINEVLRADRFYLDCHTWIRV